MVYDDDAKKLKRPAATTNGESQTTQQTQKQKSKKESQKKKQEPREGSQREVRDEAEEVHTYTYLLYTIYAVQFRRGRVS